MEFRRDSFRNLLTELEVKEHLVYTTIQVCSAYLYIDLSQLVPLVFVAKSRGIQARGIQIFIHLSLVSLTFAGVLNVYFGLFKVRCVQVFCTPLLLYLSKAHGYTWKRTVLLCFILKITTF